MCLDITDSYLPICDCILKVTASTTTRSTTRCSGDLMGDQIAPGDLMGDQIFDMTKM